MSKIEKFLISVAVISALLIVIDVLAQDTLTPTASGVVLCNLSPVAGADLDMGGCKSAMMIPIGSTGDRPATSLAGMVRYNTDITAFELYSTSWVALLPRIFNYPSRALNSCFQISSTRDADFHYKVDVGSGTLLSGTVTGTVTATSYTNSGCTISAQSVADGQASQSAALGILSVAQIASVSLDGTLPGARWMKITTSNTSGTPTFAIRTVQAETLQ